VMAQALVSMSLYMKSCEAWCSRQRMRQVQKSCMTQAVEFALQLNCCLVMVLRTTQRNLILV
jgi:hypothetical protein